MTWTFCTPAAIYPRTTRAQAPAAVGRRHVPPERRLASSRLSAPGGRAAPAHRTPRRPPDTYTTLIERPRWGWLSSAPGPSALERSRSSPFGSRGSVPVCRRPGRRARLNDRCFADDSRDLPVLSLSRERSTPSATRPAGPITRKENSAASPVRAFKARETNSWRRTAIGGAAAFEATRAAVAVARYPGPGRQRNLSPAADSGTGADSETRRSSSAEPSPADRSSSYIRQRWSTAGSSSSTSASSSTSCPLRTAITPSNTSVGRSRAPASQRTSSRRRARSPVAATRAGISRRSRATCLKNSASTAPSWRT